MANLVLDKGPSDHRPVVQDFRFEDGFDGFRAVTYNLHHGSSAAQLRPNFLELDDLDVSVWLMQEVKRRRSKRKLLKGLGLRSTFASPEFGVAWDPTVWEYHSKRRPLMSPTKYWTHNYALVVVLRHRATGKYVRFMSYHPPAHVQVPKHKTFQKVNKVLREVVRKWNRIAKRQPPKIHISANCFAGDDNVDEFKGYAPRGGWDFMLEGPLEQIRADKPTMGGRVIDDFRVSGLVAI